ncbi:hypothetical protein NQ315_014694 [Exocentrus adspersus]|uniref:Transposase n=1 Tax=Exocentrus adspersus TaxID=1586481 RepID=A0AAV8VRH6_9CUCU|nr:hypothetical protein NQ315_014694 [Exocentrus adspersus]
MDHNSIYHGFNKPNDANKFLEEFVSEVIYLTQHGLSFKERKYSFKVKGFICDVPAKCFILYTKGHSGYYSCTKCDVEGHYSNGRVCFPHSNFRLRTDNSFRQKSQEEHHTGSSILETIPGPNMVNDFALDPMHLLYLGVVKKLITLWCFGKPPSKLSAFQINLISDKLLSIKSDIPCEFNRKPRSLNDNKRWKATEFRQFILYTGPVVLQSVLKKDVYLNFLSLHIALTILSNDKLHKSYIEYAHSLLEYFVNGFIILYGEESVSHNVHNLLHLYAMIQNISEVWKNISLLKLIHKKEKPLEQIILRKIEMDKVFYNKPSKPSDKPQFSQEHSDGPTHNFTCSLQFQKVVFSKFTLKISEPDNCYRLTDGSIILIKNFVVINEKRYVLGSKINNVQDFYTKPCPSSHFGIYSFYLRDIVDALKKWDVDEIDIKYTKIKLDDMFILFPLLHM